jgi:fumarate reductase subunit C
MTNSLVSRVLRPINFYLKVWFNIMNFIMFLGCKSVDNNVFVLFRILENVVVFIINVVVFIMILYMGSSHMNV